MPRQRQRGGFRSGKPGQSYANRSDLNTALPATTTTNQQYGAASTALAGQRAVPMAAAPLPMAAAPLPQSSPAGASTPLPPPPAAAGPFSRPTDRPNEPITAGLPLGAGPGPEALGADPTVNDAADLRGLAPYLPALELIAMQPNSSIATRNFVRRLRGTIPLPMMQDQTAPPPPTA